MHITSHLGMELERYLDLSAAEMKLTASNMANLDTPGYRTLGFEFSAEMRKALRLADPAKAAEPKATELGGLLSRPDGNNVSMDREGLRMAEDQLQFKTGMELLKREFSQMRAALNDGSK